MNKNLKTLKTLISVLLSSFFAAFVGAGWVAYIAAQHAAWGQVWVPLSALGAVAACALILGLGRPFFGARILG